MRSLFYCNTQIVKTGRYNTETLYSKMPTVGVLHFEKLSKTSSPQLG